MDLWVTKQIPTALVDIANLEFDELESHDASVVGGMNDAGVINKYDYGHRSSTLRIPDYNYWLTGVMYHFGLAANEYAGWNFKVDGHECIQVADYKENQHFDWHNDVIPFSGPTDRKVTVVCLMTEKDLFEGGELLIKDPQVGNEIISLPLKKGTMVAIPSALHHKVNKVTAGIRRTATLWLNGPCYR